MVTEQLMVSIPNLLQSSFAYEIPSREVHIKFDPKPQRVSYSGPSVLPTAYLPSLIVIIRPHRIGHPKQALVPVRIVCFICVPSILSASSNLPPVKYLLGK